MCFIDFSLLDFYYSLFIWILWRSFPELQLRQTHSVGGKFDFLFIRVSFLLNFILQILLRNVENYYLDTFRLALCECHEPQLNYFFPLQSLLLKSTLR